MFFMFHILILLFIFNVYLDDTLDNVLHSVTNHQSILSFFFLSFSFSIYKSIPKSKIGSGYFSNSDFLESFIIHSFSSFHVLILLVRFIVHLSITLEITCLIL
jgi:hypothetical protein